MKKNFSKKQGSSREVGYITPSIKQAGFTLVELMVSLSLFIIVVLALISSLYNVNDASHKVQSMRTVMDNLNFAMESMSRNIRTGENIVCGGPNYQNTNHNCPISDMFNSTNQNNAISVRVTLGDYRLVEYRWNEANLSVEKKSTGLDPNGATIPGDVIDWTAITSPEIEVQNFKFYVDGTEGETSPWGDDKAHPNVIMKIEGVAKGRDGNLIPFAVQTYLSQRAAE